MKDFCVIIRLPFALVKLASSFELAGGISHVHCSGSVALTSFGDAFGIVSSA